MSFLTAIYNLFIGPLSLFFEVVFVLAYRVLENPGLSIIFLSLAMNFLVLPLYRQADAMQAQERDVEAKLQPMVKHIKKTFKGDEQYMMLQTYYRQNDYKPTYALKGSFSLLLEIPFFIAAYQFLSHLELLKGVTFGPIKDLGAPDALIVIAGLSINVLPILMTLINFVSGAIYTKGFPLKSKIQLYGVAIIFLIFLYKSPAGLVFYWTLNNVFSLVKNIFYKIKNPKLVLCILSSLTGIAGIIYILSNPLASNKKQAFVLAAFIMLQLPIIIYVVKKYMPKKATDVVIANGKSFYFGCIFLALLTGVLIPSSVIGASPLEFINTTAFENPLIYVLSATLYSIGTFVIWFGVFYMLGDKSGKKTLSAVVAGLSGATIVDYMAFGTDLGTISNLLRYEVEPNFTIKQMLINLVVIAVVFLVCYIISKKKESVMTSILAIGVLSVLVMSTINIVDINKTVGEAKEQIMTSSQEIPHLNLSKNKKNVIVIMLDRAVSAYFPYVINENENLQNQFEGFTYYPNTLSYGDTTNVATPSLFGGYEYTPIELNKRSNESLASKHNEALLVLPTVFSKAGYDVTVCDPPYAGYSEIPDLTVFDGLENTSTYITNGNMINSEVGVSTGMKKVLQRNMFCFSLFKVVPLCFQEMLYNNGGYNSSTKYSVGANKNWLEAEPIQTRENMSKAVGIDQDFTDAYTVLTSLPSITNIDKKSNGAYVSLVNYSAHEPVLLSEPDYLPAAFVDNTVYDEVNNFIRTDINGNELNLNTEGHSTKTPDQYMHYHVYMASMVQLGNWFDFLRENDVFDNTKIILVADHGRDFVAFDERKLGSDRSDNTLFYNPILLVKDFDSKGEIKFDNTFMTIADVPVLATDDAIENPKNPFSGKPITSEAKQGDQYVFFTLDSNIKKNHGNTFLPGTWYSVHDDVLNLDNWTRLDGSLNP